MKLSSPRAAAFFSPATSRATPVRPSFSNKLLFVYVALAMDIGAVHWASRGGQARTANALAFHLLGELFQVVTMLLSIISFLLLIAETYLAEQGFYALLARLFWPFFVSSPIRLGLCIGYHAAALAQLYSLGVPSLAAGPGQPLAALFIASRCASYLYYACLMVGVQRLLHDARLFSREGLKRIQR